MFVKHEVFPLLALNLGNHLGIQGQCNLVDGVKGRGTRKTQAKFDGAESSCRQVECDAFVIEATTDKRTDSRQGKHFTVYVNNNTLRGIKLLIKDVTVCLIDRQTEGRTTEK